MGSFNREECPDYPKNCRNHFPCWYLRYYFFCASITINLILLRNSLVAVLKKKTTPQRFLFLRPLPLKVICKWSQWIHLNNFENMIKILATYRSHMCIIFSWLPLLSFTKTIKTIWFTHKQILFNSFRKLAVDNFHDSGFVSHYIDFISIFPRISGIKYTTLIHSLTTTEAMKIFN